MACKYATPFPAPRWMRPRQGWIYLHEILQRDSRRRRTSRIRDFLGYRRCCEHGFSETSPKSWTWKSGWTATRKTYHSKAPQRRRQGQAERRKDQLWSRGLRYPRDRTGGRKNRAVFRIVMTYVNPRYGDRGLVVCGTLTGPAAGQNTAQGTTNSSDSSTRDTYVGKPNPTIG